MNSYHEQASSSPKAPDPVHLPEWLGETVPTGSRFSLVPDNSKYNIHDVVAETNATNQFKRFLIADNESINVPVWEQLEAANVPRLTLVKREQDSWIFGVRNGLKPLAHEALFGRESSETYIGDPEIFYEVGRLYKRAFNATGKLLINKYDALDNPLEHVAISSFSEGRGFLFLYPPFSGDEFYGNIDAAQARQLFAGSIERHFAKQVIYQESLRDTVQQLLETAKQGFTES